MGLAAAWFVNFSNYHPEIRYDTGTKRLSFPSAEVHELAYASLQSTLHALRAGGKRVFLVMQPPGGEPYDPRNMYVGSRFGSIRARENIPPFSLEKFYKDNALPRARLTAMAEAEGVILIEPSQVLCDGNNCPVVDSVGVPVYTDPLHMRPSYTRRAVTYLDQTVMQVTALSNTAP